MIQNRLLLSSSEERAPAGEHRARYHSAKARLLLGQMARLMAARTRECPPTKRYAAPEGQAGHGR